MLEPPIHVRRLDCDAHWARLVFGVTLLTSLVFFAGVRVLAWASARALAALNSDEVDGMAKHRPVAQDDLAFNVRQDPVIYPMALFAPQGEEVTESATDVPGPPDLPEKKTIYSEPLHTLQAQVDDTRIDLTPFATPCRFRFISSRAFVHHATLQITEFPSHKLPAGVYAAISHVWASAPPKAGVLNARGSFLVECEERNDGGPISVDVLHFTCDAALREGVDLVWIDRLCILQTAPSPQQIVNVGVDKKWQIMQMHEIYKRCRVTLVLTAGLRRFPDRFEATGWVERAWTFQEAMVAPEAKVLFSLRMCLKVGRIDFWNGRESYLTCWVSMSRRGYPYPSSRQRGGMRDSGTLRDQNRFSGSHLHSRISWIVCFPYACFSMSNHHSTKYVKSVATVLTVNFATCVVQLDQITNKHGTYIRNSHRSSIPTNLPPDSHVGRRLAPTIQDSALEHNSIYAALFTHDPGSSWHWAIYLHHEIQASERHDAASGHKFHATNKYGPWQYECVATDILHDQELTVLAKIGAIEDEDWGAEFFEQYLIPIPMEVPEVDHRQERVFTCRVWFREG